MIRSLLVLLFLSTLLSCKQNQEKEFLSFHQAFQDSVKNEILFQALSKKEVLIDSVLVQPRAEKVQKVLFFSKKQIERLRLFKKESLNINLQEQFDSTDAVLTLLINNIEKEKIHSSDPEFYSNLEYIKSLSNKDQITLPLGLKNLQIHYQIAIENLKTPVLEKLVNVVTEGIAGYEYLDNEVKARIISLQLKKEKERELLQELNLTQLSLKDYIAFCNSKIFDGQN